MKIIDMRARPNTAEYLRVMSAPQTQRVMSKLGSPMPPPVSLEQFVENCTALNIERVVFTGRASKATQEWDVTNEYVADAAQKYPGKIIGFAGINAIGGMDSVREIDYAINDLGLKGVSIDPFGGPVHANDRRLYPIYSKCAELGVPIVITAGPLPFKGPYLSHGSVMSIDEVASDIPELTIICDHSGWPWVNEMIAIAFRHENVYIDTSLYFHLPGGETFVEAANRWIPDKILFASGFPVVPLDRAINEMSERNFKSDVLRKIMHDNAEELLKRFGCIV